MAATEGAKLAANSQSASTGLFKGSSSDNSAMGKLTQTLVSTDLAAPIAGICDSGSVDVTGTGTTSNVTFSNCVIGPSTFNGTATMTFTQSGDTFTYTINYNNFTVTTGGVTETVSLSATCTGSTTTISLDLSCSFDVSGTGIDGRNYSVSNVSVSGSISSGFSVSATVTDPDHGVIEISTNTPVTFNCPDGAPDSGEIQVTAGGGSMTITFNDCSSFTVTRNGNPTVYNWSAI